MKHQNKQEPICGFIVGASGAGKGFCVGDVLKEFHGVHTFVTGDWCRAFCKEKANVGVLVSDDLINEAVRSHFAKHSDHYYLVDAPRSRDQVYYLMQMYRQRFPGCKLVTFHVVTTYEQSARLIRHRAIRQRRFDDAESEAIMNRLSAYFGDGGIFDTVVPILQEQTEYHQVVHAGFDDPSNAEDSHIDAVLERTRTPVRAILGPRIFGHPTPAGVTSVRAV